MASIFNIYEFESPVFRIVDPNRSKAQVLKYKSLAKIRSRQDIIDFVDKYLNNELKPIVKSLENPSSPAPKYLPV